MPLANKSSPALIKMIRDELEKINALVPRTRCGIVKNLNLFLEKLVDDEFDLTHDIPALEKLLDASAHLISNLEYAKKAAEYSASRLSATNAPFINRAKDQELETTRSLHNTELKEQFVRFKERREELSQQPGVAKSIAVFDQDAYRKGTGSSIRRSAHYAMDPRQPTQKPGNCTEQANLAFTYLYTQLFEQLSDHREVPFDSIERIDVANTRGGHCYLLMDRAKSEAIKPQKAYSVDEFLHRSDFGDTCVVVDPWNRDNAYYPASDIEEKMPRCGMHGTANIEFGLDFSNRESVEDQPQMDSSKKLS